MLWHEWLFAEKLHEFQSNTLANERVKCIPEIEDVSGRWFFLKNEFLNVGMSFGLLKTGDFWTKYFVVFIFTRHTSLPLCELSNFKTWICAKIWVISVRLFGFRFPFLIDTHKLSHCKNCIFGLLTLML